MRVSYRCRFASLYDPVCKDTNLLPVLYLRSDLAENDTEDLLAVKYRSEESFTHT